MIRDLPVLSRAQTAATTIPGERAMHIQARPTPKTKHQKIPTGAQTDRHHHPWGTGLTFKRAPHQKQGTRKYPQARRQTATTIPGEQAMHIQARPTQKTRHQKTPTGAQLMRTHLLLGLFHRN
jgi:hypothetical protein